MGSFSHKLCGWLSSLSYICEWFTRFTWFLPLFQKSYVANIFAHFQALVENLFDRKIKFFQSDAGCEIVNHSLLHHFQTCGIQHRIVCPNMLEQNGVAEHKHRHIVETGLTLQVESNLPISFWTHAFTTVIYPINKLPTPIFNGSTLYFKVYYKDPNYNGLRVFSCACYPFRSKSTHSKLDFKNSSCIFLGYSSPHKGYKCLDSANGNIFIS